MKKPLLFILFYVSCVTSFAQTYTLVGNVFQAKSTCNATFVENEVGDYLPNENIWMSFMPVGNSFKRVEIQFTQFDIHPSDTLFIYDGNNPSSPLIGVYNNNYPINLNLPIKASFGNTTRSLCFRFKSDSSFNASGWTANIYCYDVCQMVNMEIDSLLTMPHPVNNLISICKSDSVSFFANVSFPQNDINYHQSISNSVFEWKTEPMQIKTGQQVWQHYLINGLKRVYLTYKDTLGCISKDSVDVAVGAMPVVTVPSVVDVCNNQDVMLKAGYFNSLFSFLSLNNLHFGGRIDSTIFIPDGPACPPGILEIQIPVQGIYDNQIITSASDIASICVNMEHSFSGDLGFKITCPNGQTVILDPNQHSGSNGMGNFYEPDGTPACSPAANIPGQGWNYCWSEVYPNNGTLTSKKSSGPPRIDSTNTIANYNYYLPSNPLSGLIGCPVKGNWVLKIYDDWGSDNGYVFNAQISFNNSLIATLPNYQQGISNYQFSSNTAFIQVNDSMAYVNNLSTGQHSFNLKLTDLIGCVENYQTTINVYEAPVIDLGSDTSLCNVDTLVLDATCSNLSNCSYLWNLGSSNPLVLIYLDNVVRTYFVAAQKSYGNFSCYTLDSIAVTKSTQAPDAASGISGNTLVCENSQDVLYYVPPINNAFQYVWNLNGNQIASGIDNVLLLDFFNISNPILSVYAKNSCGNGVPSLLNIATNAAPAAPVISLSGNTLVSSEAMGNQWYLMGYGAIPNATNQQLNLSSNGVYYCMHTSPTTGCVSDSSNFISVTSVGVDAFENQPMNLKVAPNPFNNYTLISYYLIESAVVDLKVYSITGQTVYSMPNMKQTKGNHEIEINGNRLNQGLYFYQLKIGNQSYSGKLIRM